jgi:hypothetical protein
MRYLKTFEDIKVPIEIGDTILGGRFKNKKVVVKKIGKNKKGDITINDKPLLKYRIIKESMSIYELDNFTNDYLAYLLDQGFTFKITESELTMLIEIFTDNGYYSFNYNDPDRKPYGLYDNNTFYWKDVKDYIIPFITTLDQIEHEEYKPYVLPITITTESSDDARNFDRETIRVKEIVEDNVNITDKINKISIHLRNNF